jgi:folate-binding protein YgfZ
MNTPQAAIDGQLIVPLSDFFQVIEVGGEETEKFLQGQFTNDIREVTTDALQWSAWCSAKGRMLVSFVIFSRNDKYYLVLPGDLLDMTMKRLTMYKLRSKVALRHAEELNVLGVASADLPAGVLPMADGLGLLIDTREAVQAQAQTLAEQAYVEGDLNAWWLTQIMAGLPWVVKETSEAFVPQTANFDKINGISFNKGCYTGQEVVARSQYLGSVKRHLYRCQTHATPAPGDEVNAGAESIGKVVSAASHPDGYTVFLAVLKDAAAKPGVTVGEAEVTSMEELAA